MTANRPFEDLIEFLAKMAPEEVLAFRASDATVKRVQTLIEKEKQQSLTSEEKDELERYLIQEDLMIIAKARAKLCLAQ
ncbi:MAG: hypothetical protein OHK0019_08990 [Saprospiraceae bacterium]